MTHNIKKFIAREFLLLVFVITISILITGILYAISAYTTGKHDEIAHKLEATNQELYQLKVPINDNIPPLPAGYTEIVSEKENIYKDSVYKRTEQLKGSLQKYVKLLERQIDKYNNVFYGMEIERTSVILLIIFFSLLYPVRAFFFMTQWSLKTIKRDNSNKDNNLTKT